MKKTILEIRNTITGRVSVMTLPLSMRLANKCIRKALKRPMPNDDWVKTSVEQVARDRIVATLHRIDAQVAEGGAQ